MYNVLIVFASVTTANRVKSILDKKYGISSELVRSPASLHLEGCSYALKLKSEFLDTESRSMAAWEWERGSAVSGHEGSS